jgi:hypothetical protein
MQSGSEIINGFFLKPMIVEGSQCIVVMHKSSLVLRSNEFRDFII